MIKKIILLCTLLPQLTFASMDNLGVDDPGDRGFYFGVGVSLDSVSTNQTLKDLGPIQGIDASANFASFSNPNGHSATLYEKQVTGGPNVQLGYFRPFSFCNTRVWGFKLAYKYLITPGTTSRDVDGPTTGLETSNGSSGNEPSSINLTLTAAPSHVNHELDFVASIGQRLMHSFIYASIGPAAFNMRPSNFWISGDAQGTRTSLATVGASDVLSRRWIWGGVGQAGMVCHLGPSWFLDINFSYSISKSFKNNVSTDFTSTVTIDPGTIIARTLQTSNTGHILTQQRLTISAINITLNRVFAS